MRIICFILCQWVAFNAWAETTFLSQWLELGRDEQRIARVITSHKTCPVIKTNKQEIPMEIRTPPNTQFPVTVCQATLPSEITSASIYGHPFHLPKKEPKRIVIFGDTGCFIEKDIVQGCDNPKEWPFSLIVKHAARFKPDLVIHVGDYYYRQSHCPPGNKGCAGSPHGDNWASWHADFFQPAKPLLQKAPWIFVRGNHETCERGGEGWTKLLDPFSFKHCFNHSPIYSIPIGDTRIFIIDSANANDLAAPADQVSWYENYLREVAKSTSQYNWIITHKPFWFVFKDDTLTQTYQDSIMSTLETAWLNVTPKNVNLFISGHLHRFQSINFENNRPAQIIIGTGGARLDENMARKDLKGMHIAGAPVSQGLSLTQFGYMTLEKVDTVWQAKVRNPYGKILATCSFDHKQFICKEKK